MLHGRRNPADHRIQGIVELRRSMCRVSLAYLKRPSRITCDCIFGIVGLPRSEDCASFCQMFSTAAESSSVMASSQGVAFTNGSVFESLTSNVQVSFSSHRGMVGLGGLEPPTSPLSGARSSHLSYRPFPQRRQTV